MTRLVLLLLPLALAGCATAADMPASHGTQQVGTLRDPGLSEISGMAVSLRNGERLWLLNDGGNPAQLTAIDQQGRVTARFGVARARNRDWEDLAALRIAGRPYLLIGDIGDNRARHGSVRLHLVEEPDPDAGFALGKPLQPRSLEFRYADGARDAEGLAFDAEREEILVLSKRESPPALYRLPLAALIAPGSTPVVAERLGAVRGLLGAGLAGVAEGPIRALYGASPTALDASPDGRALYLLTYTAVYRLERAAHESWRDALLRPFAPLASHPLIQAEALAVAPGSGPLFITSEGLPAPLLRLAPLAAP